MSMLVNPYLFGGYSGPYSEFYPVGASNGSGTSYGSIPFGDEDPNRYLIVAVAAIYNNGSGGMTGVTIGGVAATLVEQHGNVSSISGASIWIAAVPTGTSGTVSFTVSNYNNFVFQVYRAVNISSPTAHDTDTLSSISLTVPNQGVALVSAVAYDTGATPNPVTFTGGVNRAYDRARAAFSVAAMRGTHTWRVYPSGGSLNSSTVFTENGNDVGASFAFTYPFAPPVAFESGHWSVADASTDGELLVTVSTIKNTGLTDIEYQVDGGSWVSSGGVVLGGKKFAIPGLTNTQQYDIAIRPVTVSGTGATSDVKQATPTDGGVTVTYLGAVIGASNLGGPTTGRIALYGGGHPHAERVIIVAVLSADDLGATANDPSAITVNGVAATRRSNNGAPGSRLAQLWSATVPDDDDEIMIQFTFSTFTTSQVIAAYKSYGLASDAADDSFNSSANPTATGVIDCPAGGFIIGAFRGHNANAVAWVGLATEDVDVAWDTSRRLSLAHESFASAQTNRTVSATQTSGTANRLTVSSWGN